MSRVLIIVNDIESGPGRLTRWLVEEDLEFDLRIGSHGALPTPEALADYAGLIMLGGGLMPDETDRAPWLREEAALVRTALDSGLPQLGICLGGQLIAHVGGGRVAAQTGAPEKGSTPIELSAAAREDRVFAQVTPSTAFIESHVDRILEIPPEAVLLASSTLCANQAFRLGEAAWGLQFHPESGPDNVRRWDPAGLAKLGFDKDELIAAADAAQPQTERDARALLAGFAAVIRGR